MLAKQKPRTDALKRSLINEFGAMRLDHLAVRENIKAFNSTDNRYRMGVARNLKEQMIATLTLKKGKAPSKTSILLINAIIDLSSSMSRKSRWGDTLDPFIIYRRNLLLAWMFNKGVSAEESYKPSHAHIKAYQRSVLQLQEAGLIQYEAGKHPRGEYNQPSCIIIMPLVETDHEARSYLHAYAYSNPSLARAYDAIEVKDKEAITRLEEPADYDRDAILAEKDTLLSLKESKSQLRTHYREFGAKGELSSLYVSNSSSSDSIESSAEELESLDLCEKGGVISFLQRQTDKINDEIQASKERLGMLENQGRLASRQRAVVKFYKIKEETWLDKVNKKQEQIARAQHFRSLKLMQPAASIPRIDNEEAKRRKALEIEIWAHRAEIDAMADNGRPDANRKQHLTQEIYRKERLITDPDYQESGGFNERALTRGINKLVPDRRGWHLDLRREHREKTERMLEEYRQREEETEEKCPTPTVTRIDRPPAKAVVVEMPLRHPAPNRSPPWKISASEEPDLSKRVWRNMLAERPNLGKLDALSMQYMIASVLRNSTLLKVYS